MQKLFTLTAALLAFTFSFAQNSGGCGTPTPSAYQHNLTLAQRMGSSPLNDNSRAGIRWIPIVYHIITKDDGTGGTGIKNVLITHCELNTAYNVFNIGFFITAIDTVMNTTLWTYQTMDNNDAFPLYNINNVVNVYVNGNLPGLCGVSSFPGFANGTQGGIFLNDDCIGPGAKTLPHEMGHYFNLLHTFETAFGKEFVDGSNCATKGDGFCDTPADCVNFRAPCPYTGPAVDAHGDLYNTVVDETLFMSYFNDNCVNRFSTQEQAEMNTTLTGARNYLLNQQVPDISLLDSVTVIAPRNGDTTLLGGNVNFRWHPVARAQYYLLHVQSATSSVVFADTLLTDTSFTVHNIQSSKTFKFQVYGMCYGNTCPAVDDYQYVLTSPIKSTIAVVTPNCPGQTDASVTVTPSNGVAPYTFQWANGDTSATINNLAAGYYTVTITDSQGGVATSTIQVTEPSPVSIQINQVGNNLNAYGQGGTGPYTYSWSNGTTGQYNNNVGAGNFTVTVTDAKGCLGTQAFLISSINNIDAKVAMKIYPNPTSGASALDVRIDVNDHVTGSVSLVTITGQVVQKIDREFNTGGTSVQFDINALSAGIFFVRFSANGLSRTEKVSIIK